MSAPRRCGDAPAVSARSPLTPNHPAPDAIGTSIRLSFGMLVAILVYASAGNLPVHAEEDQVAGPATETATVSAERDDGYRGIWFSLGQFSEYGDKYSGGLGTYTAKHVPLAVYAAEVDKTFFVYGGGRKGERYLLAMASYFDHATGEVPRPTIVHDKQGVDDPHDNPSLAIDDQGHLWVFVSGRGRRRPGLIYRSTDPYSTDAFEQILEGEFTYPQPHPVAGQGIVHLHTKYTRGRELYVTTSRDGRGWSDATKLAGMGGHYQTSNVDGDRVITAFNMHPGGNVDLRTNLYYVESRDFGKTWQTADGTTVELPMTETDSVARVRDFRSEGRLVYMKDIRFDADGNPVILVVTAANHQPGPAGEPRRVLVVHRDGDAWKFHEVAETTHNYDTGTLAIEDDGSWRVFTPSGRGPQRWGTGGEVEIWASHDAGETWAKERDVTSDSEFNHGYVRQPVNAHDDFYAFWADGNPDELSPSRLYFTNRAGTDVWQLPYDMDGDRARPRRTERPRQ